MSSELGLWEFAKRGDPPVVGITKLENGVTLETLKNPRRKVPLGAENPKNTSENSSSGSAPSQ